MANSRITNAAAYPLKTLPDADLWRRFQEDVRELRVRNQIAVAWWSLDDIDFMFDGLRKRFEPVPTEPHRANFRIFALKRIGHFLARDAAFNNRVKRELHVWLKEHAGTPPTSPVDDDTREFWDAVGDIERHG